ncbi:MAG: tetratricopeptide repeat protein [Alphaproteobacteria bacterium]
MAGAAFAQKDAAPQIFPEVKPDQIAVPQPELDPTIPAYAQTMSGNYLSSMFAQRHHDWSNARLYLKDLLGENPDDPQLLKRAMIIAVGSNEMNLGIEFARKVQAVETDNAMALLFLATHEFHEKNYKAASDYIVKMPKDSLSEFIIPLWKAWSSAAQGKSDIAELDKNIIHINHAVLISDYLKDYTQLETLLKNALKNPNVSTGDRMIIADVYAHMGQAEKALELYKKTQVEYPDEPLIVQKIAALATKDKIVNVAPVSSPEQGMATALLDMAKLLFQEYSDDSARVFANLALHLDPKMIDADLLLGSITARNERYDEAIDYYRKVQPDSPYFLESRRKAADLLLDAGRQEEALNELATLAYEYKDTNSLIRIGDVYRQTDQFTKALEIYNEAAIRLGEPVPPEYWYLYYVRGISNERAGNWDLAEKDLKTALKFQPDHPYVLNYLGYAWADQDKNLDKALEMVIRASEILPEDGYITDSLGWVYFKMGQYEDATATLEKAVQLLPQDPTINDHLGDVYWQIGRKREAHFQWNRARNFTKDVALKSALAEKIANGPEPIVKEASTQAAGPAPQTATP